jgi:hypothetical protein
MPMTMPMMKIGVVRVAVYHVNVSVPVSVWLPGRVGHGVLMLVMNIVTMPMPMLERLVTMFVLVAFSQVQPQANAHQAARENQLHR